MICALIRTPPEPEKSGEWEAFLELVTSLALFGQPLRLVVLESAGQLFTPPKGMLEETLVELSSDIHFESNLPRPEAASQLIRECLHCVVF